MGAVTARDPSIEFPDQVCMITIRTIASRLWFVNNQALEEKILAFLAKYQEIYDFQIYAFVLMGNHYHLLARFPHSNRHEFLNAFDAIIPKLVAQYQDNFIDGKLWARRPRVQIVPKTEDILDKFFYISLNPVTSGLVHRVSDYPGYCCIQDSIHGESKPYTIVDWSAFNNAKRHNPRAKQRDYEEQYRIRFSRLPGHENSSRAEYKKFIESRLRVYQQQALEKRVSEGKGIAGKRHILSNEPGMLPENTKVSERYTPRPLVLTSCAETKRIFLEIYFGIVDAYRKASARYRAGYFDTNFPPGTHRPRSFVAPA